MLQDVLHGSEMKRRKQDRSCLVTCFVLMSGVASAFGLDPVLKGRIVRRSRLNGSFCTSGDGIGASFPGRIL